MNINPMCSKRHTGDARSPELAKFPSYTSQKYANASTYTLYLYLPRNIWINSIVQYTDQDRKENVLR